MNDAFLAVDACEPPRIGQRSAEDRRQQAITDHPRETAGC